jgi:hypothetical protein
MQKCILSKEDLETWIGIVWLTIWKIVGCSEHGNELSGFEMQEISCLSEGLVASDGKIFYMQLCI